MKLVLTAFLSLDGVYQGPGAPDEDTTGGFTRGGWLVPFIDDIFERQAATWLQQAGGLLFGRRTYEAFAIAWPQMSDSDDRFAPLMNSLPKWVVSNTIDSAAWEPTTIIHGDPTDEVARLKNLPGRELQIHGSGTLGRSMLSAGLVDELRLVIAPVILAQGRRLFPTDGPAHAWKVVEQSTTPAGLTIKVLESAAKPEFGTYGVNPAD